MGPAVAATFLQRALTALAAFDAFLALRGTNSGETVLLRALEALQDERYLRLAERRPANETHLHNWLANRTAEPELSCCASSTCRGPPASPPPSRWVSSSCSTRPRPGT